MVTIANIKPKIAAGRPRTGIFHPTAAPAKHKASSMPVLLTAPSKVILSAKGMDDDCDEKFRVNAGFPDLPNVFSAECFDIKIPFLCL
jgi:hypothetical protein